MEDSQGSLMVFAQLDPVVDDLLQKQLVPLEYTLLLYVLHGLVNQR